MGTPWSRLWLPRLCQPGANTCQGASGCQFVGEGFGMFILSLALQSARLAWCTRISRSVSSSAHSRALPIACPAFFSEVAAALGLDCTDWWLKHRTVPASEQPGYRAMYAPLWQSLRVDVRPCRHLYRVDA